MISADSGFGSYMAKNHKVADSVREDESDEETPLRSHSAGASMEPNRRDTKPAPNLQKHQKPTRQI